ncbi:dihydroxyacetone kinase subunit DhaL [Consotaella salsifontis]|uniref:Homodimeric dihydroxyacetone kinase n=1 Tax=Consotaella salsifontis TaxID=1365950 RepID=A0A1T4RD73_9HYPH|nr:dihydroxyacetone kinase subunit DhaL [Consotaella salsifontis]SKA13980.1 homodimeric dihydroxyacetone kinase [Consotaella salsifontis]
MKKLINSPKAVVREMLEGIVAQAPNLAILDKEMVVVRNPLPAPEKRKVAIISGGGSGHEPAHAGYVGQGMLTAAVAGDVFTSPSTDAVLSSIRAVAGPAGAVLVVKNYTGDRLNFGLAAEMARAEGIPCEVVLVADDVALRNTVEKGRRRGIAGTVFVHKIAGAAAEAGKSLEEVVKVANAAAADIGTMGVALGSCTLPAVGKPGFTLGETEIELGLGIHGEAGVERGEMREASELAKTILDTIISDLDIKPTDRLALLVNGLGATPPMELSIVARGALAHLRERGLKVERSWTGTFLSALDMPGCSLSLFKLDDARVAALDLETDAMAWPRGGKVAPDGGIVVAVSEPEAAAVTATSGGEGGAKVKAAADAACKALIAAEPALTELDSKAGDGDLGQSMQRGSEAVQALSGVAWADASTGLKSIGDALRRAIAGSSGPFYATGFLRASRELAGKAAPTPQEVATAFMAGVEAVSTLGGAKEGDRTMLDALFPAAKAFGDAVDAGKSQADAWKAAADAAEKGAQATETMKARLGRASYLGDRATGIPDGGAKAVSIWMRAIADSL